MAKEIRQSTTKIIMRSEINLNPLNPKRHTENGIKLQKKNLQKVGYLGGVTYNLTSHNLIDGHRRVMALDSFYGYDGTKNTDYQIKVEAIDLSEKEEKEQMTYMALGNTRADYDLIAEYVQDIDFGNIGLPEEDIKAIMALVPDETPIVVDSFDDLIADMPPAPKQERISAQSTMVSTDEYEPEEELSPEEKKQLVIDAKRQTQEKALERQRDEDAFITISFSSHQAKAILCEILDVDESVQFVKGEQILELIQ